MEYRKELIGEIKKNSQETVKVHVTFFKDMILVDARIFVQNDSKGPGVLVPTQKGLCLTSGFMLKLLPILIKAQKRADELSVTEW